MEIDTNFVKKKKNLKKKYKTKYQELFIKFSKTL